MHLVSSHARRIRHVHAPHRSVAHPAWIVVVLSAEFVYRNDSVMKVGKAGYYHCNETAPDADAAAPRDGTTLFVLDAPGPAYFASADLAHCNMGQRLAVDVLADRAAPGPWAAPGPSAHHSAAAPPTYSAARAVALMVPVALALAVGFV